jgi:hypothetical protein
MSKRNDQTSPWPWIAALAIGVGAAGVAFASTGRAAPSSPPVPPGGGSGGGSGSGGVFNEPRQGMPSPRQFGVTPPFTPGDGAAMANDFLLGSAAIGGGILGSLIDRGIFDPKDDGSDGSGSGSGGGSPWDLYPTSNP